MREIPHQVSELCRREKFLEEANAAYRALKKKAPACRDEKAERAAWQATLADGIEPEPLHSEARQESS